MVTKIQIKDIFGTVLFEYEKENNTIKDTLEEGVRKGINFSFTHLSGADLRGANLSFADLRKASLSGANISEADLRGANLWHANLHRANLSEADFCSTNLSGADISEADLRGANLSFANLCRANIYGANISGAKLSEANLCRANLSMAYLSGADLSYADLTGVSLYNTDIDEAKNVPNIPMACPSEGAFIGWKKVNGCLVQLEIPEGAKRSSATTNKCRCDKAKVLSITDLDGRNPIDEIVNDRYKPSVTYKVGKMVYPDGFDEVRWNECSNGIHFFMYKEEAINYYV